VKYILAISLLLLSGKIYPQTDSLIFTTNSEISVTRYIIQQSADTSNWVNDTTFIPKKNITNRYSYNLTKKNIYFRVKAVMTQGNYFTFAIGYFNKPPTLNIYPNIFNQTLN
jgi:hypothetical protein